MTLCHLSFHNVTLSSKLKWNNHQPQIQCVWLSVNFHVRASLGRFVFVETVLFYFCCIICLLIHMKVCNDLSQGRELESRRPRSRIVRGLALHLSAFGSSDKQWPVECRWRRHTAATSQTTNLPVKVLVDPHAT